MLQVVWVYIWMISKHLMLLFNVPDFKSFIWMFPFQNISCYCLTNTLLRSIFIANISKHLMLLFNPNPHNPQHTAVRISKHLMLLFNIGVKLNHILLWAISKHLMLLFNSIAWNAGEDVALISKHLMLLFNTFTRSEPFFVNIFQNISCYCLTHYYLLMDCLQIYFKTSHVIV